MTIRLTHAVLFAAIGSAPGLVLVALAAFVIRGEMELTVGAPGILIAVLGAVAGFIYGLQRRPPTPGD